MRRALGLGICLAVLATAHDARAARPHHYLLPGQMRHAIEAHGFTIEHEHLLVRRAACAGLPRYGVSGAAFGGFTCRAVAPDGSVYLLQTVALTARSFGIAKFGIESTTDETVANCLDWSGSPRACIKELSG